MQTIISLVSAGLGVALIPASMRNLGRTGVVYRGLREQSPETEILVAWRHADTGPALMRFLESVDVVVQRRVPPRSDNKA
jgi:DNA-binding transcriptional LysR family regulator